MANQELLDKTYKIPSNVIKYIQSALVSNSTGDGIKRAKFLVKNGAITYQAMKRLKNFFDTFNPQVDNKNQYMLAGGDLMKSFVETTLNSERNGVKARKEIRRDITTNPNSELMPYQAPRLTEGEKKLSENAIAVIVNDDYKILLLKRSSLENMWMPNKWALVGGGIEKNETPEQACKREIFEETGLKINKFIETFSIERHGDSIEHVFACKYDGDLDDITLNEENSNYGWFDLNEMNYLDIVPHLVEYITIAFKNYN